MDTDIRLDLALIHHPVVNRIGEIIGSAVTNLDLHDIARAGKTYGVTSYWVVTPHAQQQKLAGEIVGHWTEGYGGSVNPDRANALSIIRISNDLEAVIAAMTERDGCRPMLVASSAGGRDNVIDFAGLRTELLQGRSVLLLLGTAWGLAPEIMGQVDATLQSIKGPGEYNHLSVRSAASIMLDRLLGNR
jgi:hypothetical protein